MKDIRRAAVCAASRTRTRRSANDPVADLPKLRQSRPMQRPWFISALILTCLVSCSNEQPRPKTCNGPSLAVYRPDEGPSSAQPAMKIARDLSTASVMTPHGRVTHKLEQCGQRDPDCIIFPISISKPPAGKARWETSAHSCRRIGAQGAEAVYSCLDSQGGWATRFSMTASRGVTSFVRHHPQIGSFRSTLTSACGLFST